jgi:uracil-DNA glycosylase family 4
MRWSERQQTLLQAMGLRLWLPAPEPLAAPDDTPLATAPQALRQTPVLAPVPMPAPAPAEAPAVLLPAATSSAVHTMDWPALQAAVAGCRACGLCETRRHTVFGVGHPQARLMVVGEAPGEQEDLSGEPFVGAAGQLLDRMLTALGLSRGEAEPGRQVFIANTLKCRPPRNRNPAPEELAACQPFLERQVALVQPKVILAMGKFAVQTLLGSDAPVGKLRGQVHRWRGVPLVVTYHPAYLLRQPADKARAWDDLCLAHEVMAQTTGQAPTA